MLTTASAEERTNTKNKINSKSTIQRLVGMHGEERYVRASPLRSMILAGRSRLYITGYTLKNLGWNRIRIE